MNILLLTQFLPPVIGGIERHVWTLARELGARSHQVTLMGFAAQDEVPQESAADGVRVVRVRPGASRLPFVYSDRSRPHAMPVPDPMVSRAIRRELAERRFDVVHAHNWIVNSALGPASRARVPVVMTLHDYSHGCATGRFMHNGATPCRGPALGRCLPCSADHFGAVKGPATVLANRWSARARQCRVTAVAAVSGAVAAAMGDLDAEVIPNFIPDGVVREEIAPVAADAPLLFVGDVSRDKGVQVLLDAYRMLERPPALALAGRPSGGFDPDLPEGVCLLGPVPHEQVSNLFSTARAVVVPSVWSDPCPTVVLEAMAAGRPVVASSSGGIPDMVVSGVTGVLVAPGDTAALAGAIGWVIDHPDRAEAMGEAGRDRSRQFTVSAAVGRIEAMYARAIAKTTRPVAHVG